MKLFSFLKEDICLFNKTYNSKQEALKSFTELLVKQGYIKNANKALKAALEREAQFPTSIGYGVGMPHILNDTVLKPCILFAKVKKLDWSDTEKVEYIFFICLNKKAGDDHHMQIIQQLSSLLLNDNFINALAKIKTYDKLVKTIETNLPKDDNEAKNIEIEQDTNGYDIVAVTACPTGVAHTFLSAEMLEKTAKEKGLKIKVETQGTEGSRNTLTVDDIKNAKGVILALDRSIEMSRFGGHKNVLEISTRAVIKNATKQIEASLNGEGKELKPTTNNSSQYASMEDTNLMTFKNFGKRSYRGVMNGVGHMLPFVIFGGIMIALAFMIDMFTGVPDASISKLGEYHEASRWFKGIGSLAFNLMVPILAAYMAFGLIGKGGLLPGFLCGMIATGVFTNNGIPWLMEGLPQDLLLKVGSGSGFFGSIGGALVTSCLYILITKYILDKMPKSLSAIKNILFMPLFGTFVIVGLFFLINIPLQFVNLGFGMFLDLFAQKPELYPLLGVIMGMMMCFDLGGPVNKAAYIFGTITIASAGVNGSVPMAIAMASGMVPPIAIALSTTFNKSLWTEKQVKEGYVNYIMGLSFISEGAIPYTAEQPKKMIISNLVGGAITGIIIGSLQVSSLAPHGGIFVAPLLRTGLFADNLGMSIGLGITFFIGGILVGALAEAAVIWTLTKYTKFGANKQLAVA